MSIKVAVDAGHAFSTAGKRSDAFKKTVTHTFNGKTITVNKGETFREHVANSGVAEYLAEFLESKGFDVIRTGFDDFDGTDDSVDVSISNRQKEIRNYGCEYSFSCHFNAYTGKWNTASGTETLYDAGAARVGDGKLLAQYIQKHIQPIYNQKDRGAKSATGLGMCNSTGMGCKASVLMEYAFMDNENEAYNYFCNPEAWYKYAIGVGEGFLEYLEAKGIDWEKENDVSPVLKLQKELNAWIKSTNQDIVLLTEDGIFGTKSASAWLKYQEYLLENKKITYKDVAVMANISL